MWGLRLLTWGLPWVVVAGVDNPYLEPKALLFTAVGWGMICWRMFRLPEATPLGWRNPWTLWVAWWVLGVSCWKFQWLYLQRPPFAQQAVYNSYAWLGALSVLMALLLLQTLATTYLVPDLHVHLLTRWMIWCAALVACYGLLQTIGFDQFYVAPVAGSNENPIHAGFGNPGYVAVYLAMLLPLCFVFASPRYLLMAVLMMVVIWLTHARYAWGIAGAGLSAAWLARWWPRLSLWKRLGSVVALACVGGIVVAWGLPLLMADERWNLWQQIIQKLHSTPEKVALAYTGYGINSLPLLVGEAIKWAHNEWLQLVVEIGLIGTTLVAGMVTWATRAGWRAAQSSMLASGWFGVWIAFLTASLIHFPGHIPPLAWVGLCALAIVQRTEGVAYA